MTTGDIIPDSISTSISNTLPCNSCQIGGSVSSVFQNLAVPAGLLYLQQKHNAASSDYVETESAEPISESLFDRLYELANADTNVRKQPKTRRKKMSKANKTRRT